MKLPIVILIVWACRSIGADTNSINIVLSPFYSDTAKATASTFVTEVLKSAPRNSRVVFTDGWGLSTIADVTIPDLKIDKPSTRATFLRQSLGKLSKWFLDVGKLEPVALSGTSAVRIPEVLKQRTGSDVVIVGSPIFQSVTEPSFSFGTNSFPSDGHLKCDLEESMFSIKSKSNYLTNARVHFLYPSEGIFSSDLYKHYVQRFWRLFTEGQDGTLASFSGDQTKCLATSLRGEAPLPKIGFEIDPRMDKVEMLTVRRAVENRIVDKAATRIQPSLNQQQQSVAIQPGPNNSGRMNVLAEQGKQGVTTAVWFENSGNTNSINTWTVPMPMPVVNLKPAELPESAPVPESLPFGRNSIGVMWDTDADVDLYVETGSGDPLHFKNRENSVGRYVHDFTNANNGLDYEYVIFNSIEGFGRARAFVNLYRAKLKRSVAGKCIVTRNGISKVLPFEIKARIGNSGTGWDQRGASEFWTELDLR